MDAVINNFDINREETSSSTTRFRKKSVLSTDTVSHNYLPAIHRAKTAMLPSSTLNTHLETLSELLPHDRPEREVAVMEATAILDRLIPMLKIVSSLSFKNFYFIENTSQFDQNPKTVYCVLPIKYDFVKIKYLEPGYVTFRLPKVATGKPDYFENLRSFDDPKLLSLLKFKEYLSDFLKKSFHKILKAKSIQQDDGQNVKLDTELTEKIHSENASLNVNDMNANNSGENVVQMQNDSTALSLTDHPAVNIEDNLSCKDLTENLDDNSLLNKGDSVLSNGRFSTSTCCNDNHSIQDQDKTLSDEENRKSSTVPEKDNLSFGEDGAVTDTLNIVCVKEDGSLTDTTTIEHNTQNTNNGTDNKTVSDGTGENPGFKLKWTRKLLNSKNPSCYNLPCGWRLELIPSIFVSAKDPSYIPKPYERDEHSTSDVVWRMCYSKRESKILKTISKTDKQLRLKSIRILYELFQCDSRLRFLSVFQIQNCVLHDTDHLLDAIPRWQRQNLETCLKTLMTRISFFMASKHLPHFFMNDFNLLETCPKVQLNQARNAIDRLCANQTLVTGLAFKAIQRHSTPET